MPHRQLKYRMAPFKFTVELGVLKQVIVLMTKINGSVIADMHIGTTLLADTSKWGYSQSPLSHTRTHLVITASKPRAQYNSITIASFKF